MGSISIPVLLTDQLLTPDNLQLHSEGLQNHEVRKFLQIYSFVFEKWTHGTILREFDKAHCQPSTGLTPTPLNSGCFTGGEKPHIILLCVYSTVPQGPGLRLSSWQPSPDQVDTEQVRRKCSGPLCGLLLSPDSPALLLAPRGKETTHLP